MNDDEDGLEESARPRRLDLDISRFRESIGTADRLGRGFAANLSRAFIDVAVRGRSLADVVSDIGLRLSRAALTEALKPVENMFTKFLINTGDGIMRALTGSIAQPTQPVTAFAKGGVLAAPTYFPLVGGMGLAGESGPEAILPLARGADGGLGVRAEGGGAARIAVTFNVTTPDAESFRRSEAEVAAMLARVVDRGSRGR